MTWTGGLAFSTLLAAQAQAQKAEEGAFPAEEQEWAEELRADDFAGDASGLTARIEFGCGAGRVGFRIEAGGGAPFSAGAMRIERQRVDGSYAQASTQAVLFDAGGRASVTVREFSLGEELRVRFTSQSATGTRHAVSNPVVIPSQGGAWNAVVQRGDVVISEIMKDPSFVPDTSGEWFELVNVAPQTRNIAGWHLKDLGTSNHTINNGGQVLLIAPGQHLVLGINADPATNGGVHVDYKYSSFTLGNGADSILLVARNGMLVDEVDYDDGIFWPDTPGASLCLQPSSTDAYLNDDPANWCSSKSLMGSGNTDLGTPGAINDTCP